MPDLFDLDEAFETLTRDVSSRGTGPGATTAIGTSRRRRRTAVGAVVAVAALAIGGVTAAQLGDGDSRSTEVVDDSVRPLPEAAPLDADALSAATGGWTTTWSPAGKSPADSEVEAMECLAGAEQSSELSLEPIRSGEAVLQADGGGLAYAAFAEFTRSAPVGDILTALSDAMRLCGMTSRHDASYGEARSATHFGLDMAGKAHDVWIARLDQRMAVLFLSGASTTADEGTGLLVGDALVAAMRDGEVLQSTGVDEGSSNGGYATGSESGGESYEFPVSLGYSQLAGILDAESWEPDGTGFFDLPCVAASVEANSDSSTGSTLGSHAVVGYTSYTSFSGAAGLTALQTILPACDTATWTLHPSLVSGDSALWASSDAGVVFAVQHGPHLAVLQVRDQAAPSDEAAAQVLTLLQASVASARVVDEAASGG